MTENKKAALLIGGLVSAALCSTGFANRTEVMQTEKVVTVSTGEMIENVQNIQYLNYINPECTGTMQELCQKIEDMRKTQACEAKKRQKEKKEKEERAAAVSQANKSLLASIIFCEAGNQPYEGQVAVGAVVMNRVRSGSFPGTIEEVIYQSGQFTPACTGWLDQVRSAGSYTGSAMQAASDALAGENPVGECLYFDRGGSGMQIGDHFFH